MFVPTAAYLVAFIQETTKKGGEGKMSLTRTRISSISIAATALTAVLCLGAAPAFAGGYGGGGYGPKPTPQPTVTTDPTPDPTTDPEPTPDPEPTVTPDPEPTVTPDPEPTTDPDPDPVIPTAKGWTIGASCVADNEPAEVFAAVTFWNPDVADVTELYVSDDGSGEDARILDPVGSELVGDGHQVFYFSGAYAPGKHGFTVNYLGGAPFETRYVEIPSCDTEVPGEPEPEVPGTPEVPAQPEKPAQPATPAKPGTTVNTDLLTPNTGDDGVETAAAASQVNPAGQAMSIGLYSVGGLAVIAAAVLYFLRRRQLNQEGA